MSRGVPPSYWTTPEEPDGGEVLLGDDVRAQALYEPTRFCLFLIRVKSHLYGLTQLSVNFVKRTTSRTF